MTAQQTHEATSDLATQPASAEAAQHFPVDVQIRLIEDLLRQSGQVLSVLSRTADLLGAMTQQAQQTPVVEMTRDQHNTLRLAEIKDDHNDDLARLLLSMLDEDGAPRPVHRVSEYPALARVANYKNPGAVSRSGWVDISDDDEHRIVSDKGMQWLRDLGFRVA